jgi:hypothetical protein
MTDISNGCSAETASLMRSDAKVPTCGHWAYLSGWAEIANPFPPESDGARRWADDWAFQDRVAKSIAGRA